MTQLFRDFLTLANLAWPVVISRIGIMTLTVVDTVMVGRYASEHLAYLGVGLVPHNIFILIMLGLIMGTSVLVSNRYGAGELQKTGEIWWIALPWALGPMWRYQHPTAGQRIEAAMRMLIAIK